SYDQPAHDLTFRGLTFSHTSWLAPNSTDGYADQQTGAFIFGSGYAEFEATRPKWHQMPAAVQVSAAKGISFLRDRFVAIGQAALGIGNDDNAHLGKLGLGADTINVTGCLFTQIAAGAIVIGGIQENAHHPSDPRMTNQNMMISNNLIHDVAIDYRDGAGLLFTYTKNVVVSHNELYNLPYSGIATGYGWGANDAGGSDDYANRGLYKYQTRYTTATIAQQNQVVANYLHDGMQQMNDGGCHYNLSANPMTVVTQNYCKGPWPASSFGDYEDEGSRYLTITKNVFSGWGSWATANANATNHTGDLMFTNNWVSGSQGIRGSNNTITGNVTISGALPADAMTVVNAAGLEPAYADLKTAP
ncbi:MAG TPA: right-handed parallel beta-helix repeat-containing protein, partial [Polyangia bacterium]